MTRDEIYDHLAKVYLGKKYNTSEQEKQKKFNAWLVINIFITIVIFASSFYGLSAFLTHKSDALQNRIIYSLTNGPIRINYNLEYPYPPVKTFSLSVPKIKAERYNELQFSVKAMEEGSPGMIRVQVRNTKNEQDTVVIENIDMDWKTFSIPFEEFSQITDWDNVSEIDFVLESWNAADKDGIILIEDICFSS